MHCYEFDQQFLLTSGPKDQADLPGLSLRNEMIPSVVLAGVDEAGRGPLAGPVVAAAVVLPSAPLIDGLRDSKAATPKLRAKLYDVILAQAVAAEVAIIEPSIIDAINILAATMQAMRQAVLALKTKPTLVLIDGNQKPGSGFQEKAIVKGDAQSACIMAASILAKVTRDRIMEQAHLQYPMYGFNEHKGYGCKSHMEALQKYGPCPLHRRSFEPVRTLTLAGNFLSL